jgi:parallel beta-helix repeat protein
VTGNTVQGCAMPGILVTSTAGLRIENNTMGTWTDSKLLPGLMRKAGLTQMKPVVEIQCAP